MLVHIFEYVLMMRRYYNMWTESKSSATNDKPRRTSRGDIFKFPSKSHLSHISRSHLHVFVVIRHILVYILFPSESVLRFRKSWSSRRGPISGIIMSDYSDQYRLQPETGVVHEQRTTRGSFYLRTLRSKHMDHDVSSVKRDLCRSA